MLVAAKHGETSASYLGNRWLGAPIDAFDDPWYRFSRVFSVLDRAVRVAPGSAWLDLGCHQGQFVCDVEVQFQGGRRHGLRGSRLRPDGCAGQQKSQGTPPQHGPAIIG